MPAPASAKASSDEEGFLRYLVDHLFLPPKSGLGDDSDPSIGAFELRLVDDVSRSLERFAALADELTGSAIRTSQQMAQHLLLTRPSGTDLRPQAIREALKTITEGGVLALHLRAQNAGVLITRTGENLTFEAFELLAPNEVVMTCRGRLVRSFPSVAIALGGDIGFDSHFLEAFAEGVAHLDVSTNPEHRPQTLKAGVENAEERDSVNPTLVIEMLMSWLRGLGGKSAQVIHIQKKSREQVNYNEDHRLAWHRSALWLFLRVILRLTLDRADLAAGKEPSTFKIWMAFHMSTVLDKCRSADFSSDDLFAMSAKICRRVHKLHLGQDTPWLESINRSIRKNQELLQDRWKRTQQRNSRQLDASSLKIFDLEHDEPLDLKCLNWYINEVEKRSCSPSTHVSGKQMSQIQRQNPGVLPTSLGSGAGPDLLAFEAWVMDHLDEWTESQLSGSCPDMTSKLEKLKTLIVGYHSFAKKVYSKNPEGMSIAYLSILELWVACDKLATHCISFMADYQPGISHEMFDTLLLPGFDQMVRLHAVERHLQKRSSASQVPCSPLSDNFGHQNSFAVRYFHETPQLSTKLLQTRSVEARCRQEKLEELQDLKDEYKELMETYEAESHQTVSKKNHKGRWMLACTRGCAKCRAHSSAQSLHIQVWEDILPKDDLQAKSVIAELHMNSVVRTWRDVTLAVLRDVFANPKSEGDSMGTKLYWLADNQAGRQARPLRERLELASTVKPYIVAHFRQLKVSEASPKAVCKPHGSKYSYWDSKDHLKMSGLLDNSAIPTACSFAALVKSCPKQHTLEPYIRRSTHTSNMVIANRHDCPETMSNSEFQAFGHLRAGLKLQWQNILGQLISPSLNLRSVETCLLLMQASCEAGPQSTEDDVLRTTHGLLSDDEFASILLDGLELSFNRAKENSESANVFSILSRLCLRVLSISSSTHVQKKGLTFLAQLRNSSFQWACQLFEKVDQSESATEREDSGQMALSFALTCHNSFDIPPRRLAEVLRTDENMTMLTTAAVLCREHQNIGKSSKNPLVKIMRQHCERLSHAIERVLARELTCQDNQSLNKTVKYFWPAFEPGTSWSTGLNDADGHHVLRNVCAAEEGKEALSVSFDLLTGRLRVNDLPISTLPEEYQSHDTFKLLFGCYVPKVVASNREGMQFSGSRKYHDWDIHFAIRGEHLIVRAVQNQQQYQFIPSSELGADFPSLFRHNYYHWLNSTTGDIEFRPLGSCWQISSASWRLNLHDQKMMKNGSRMLGLRSNTVRAVSRYLEPLEASEHITCILADERVVIELPRLHLRFLLEAASGSLASQNYPGMYVDEDQSLGTLIGFKSRLVLRSREAVPELDRRIVLVPQGIPSLQVHGQDVSVGIPGLRIVNSTASKAPLLAGSVRYCVFQVDNKLKKLGDSGLFQDKIYLALLHALTSSCLPDPLTERTGTEEALRILSSAAVKSFQTLDEENKRSLRNISALSPKRCYYPKHLHAMETVKWSTRLPSLSQDDAFEVLVRELLAYNSENRLLFPDAQGRQSVEYRSSILLAERAIARNAVVRVSGFGAEKSTSVYDVEYRGRCPANEPTKRCQRAAGITRLLMNKEEGVVEKTVSSVAKLNLEAAGTRVEGLSCVTGRPVEKLKLDIQVSFQSMMKDQWCRIHELLCHHTDFEAEKYRLGMIFSAYAFSRRGEEAWQTIQTLCAFATSPQMRAITPERVDHFPLSNSDDVEAPIRAITEQHTWPLEACPENKIHCNPGELTYAYENRKINAHEANVIEAVDGFVHELKSQLPCREPLIPTNKAYSDYIDRSSTAQEIRDVFEKSWRWRQFRLYMAKIAEVMQTFPVAPAMISAGNEGLRTLVTSHSPSHRGFVNLHDLFSGVPPVLQVTACKSTITSQNAQLNRLGHSRTSESDGSVSSLLKELKSLASDPYERQYISELEQSLGASGQVKNGPPLEGDLSSVRSLLEQNLGRSKEQLETSEGLIRKTLGTTATWTEAAKFGTHWPRTSPLLLLQQLSRDKWHRISIYWKRCLVTYALSLTKLQQAERLAAAQSWVDMKKEFDNLGHTNWDPIDYPESLLMEVENGLLIRPVQENIASQMRAPPKGHQSAVMQLNMGEGKSSVIVPIVAAALADKTRLVRIVVAKPQFKQMSHTMISKLGGLLDRRVYFLPFSRSLSLDAADAVRIREMMISCMKAGGVLLVQPEHLLSFKLMGLESFQSDKQALGRELLSSQLWLDEVARDIVDESDENFNVKFELVYTIGTQQQVDLGSQRWQFIQCLLGLVEEICAKICRQNSSGIQYERSHPDRFPVIRILEPLAGQSLTEHLADHLCQFGIDGFPLHRQPHSLREKVKAYITQTEISQDVIRDVEDDENGFFCGVTQGPLWLLRGLIAGGVLLFTLRQKRWKVNYGRTKTRTPQTLLAVPFRAKDSPALRSEFSHPDVVIVLTCLTYYYEGLTDDELENAFERLDRSDQAEFDLWVRGAPTLEPAFRTLSSINLRDRNQCIERIYPKIRHSKAAIDFYLSKVVFAQHMREFPKKLSASGWDLARQTAHPMTGFSGTCDSKYVLPLTITHLDLPEQQHTNASVLRCLLRPENYVRELRVQKDEKGSELFSKFLIKSVVEMDTPIQVILDVGAQVLELNNIQAAREWLKIAGPKYEAVIFCDDDDELLVLNRNNKTEKLLASAYLHQPEKCLVFLDEAHTRGTDLKLPGHYRAAVTLGPKLTKDRLVQACMRMRKLGLGQSVTFFAPPEIQRRIRQIRGMASQDSLKVSDVLAWSIMETWLDLRKSVPLWATQGIRHQKQEVIWQRSIAGGEKTLKNLDPTELDRYLEDEAQTLAQRYAPKRGVSQNEHLELGELDDPDLAPRWNQLRLIRQKCWERNMISLDSAALQEEQERELSPELERETQVQRPHPKQPALHKIEACVKTFVTDGRFTLGEKERGFLPAFTAFQESAAAKLFNPRQFPCDIYVTADFARTIVVTKNHVSDLYQRPVHWVVISKECVSRPGQRAMVIMSPWEVNMLYDKLRMSKHVTLHQYIPRKNLAFPSLDDLTLFTLPRLPEDWTHPGALVIQLNLFAGQLWLNSYDQYIELCRFLGLSYKVSGDEERIGADGFEGKTKRNPACVFRKSPVPFLEAVLGIRTDAQGINRTDMGRIVRGEILREEDFEGREDGWLVAR